MKTQEGKPTGHSKVFPGSLSPHLEPSTIDPPLYLNYAGFRGSLQVFGAGRPWQPVYWRAGFNGPGRWQLESSAHLVSRPPGRLVINPFGFASWEPSDPFFAESFLVYIASPKIIPVLSEPALFRALHNLRHGHDASPVDVYISPSWVVVRKYCGERHLRDQIRFVHLVTALLETLPWQGGRPRALPTSSGAGLPLKLQGALCQVCGDPLFNPVALCRDCATPHHMDCWRYAGGCSTYACLGLAADVATVDARG